MYKWRHLIENFFGKLKEIQTDRHARRQNRSELRRLHPSRRRSPQLQMNLNRL
jgi:hypothetical protein